MERFDWSCAYCHQGRHVKIPYYRSNVQILGLFLIDREQFHHQGALRVNCIVGSDWSRAVTWPMTSQIICLNLHNYTLLRWNCRQRALRFCRRFWWVESSHVTYDVTHTLRACCAWAPVFVLLPCSFAMIRSPEGAATSQMCRGFWWVERRHVT